MDGKVNTHSNIAGAVLAGGRSSRMGTNKALMPWRGKPLIEHMMELLRHTGCQQVVISGEVQGYPGISDSVRHEGPAKAMAALLRHFQGKYDRVLFVPVDMPLLSGEALLHLIEAGTDACYAGHPLPAILRTTSTPPDCRAVHELLQWAGAVEMALPREFESAMANANTKEEWEAIAP